MPRVTFAMRVCARAITPAARTLSSCGGICSTSCLVHRRQPAGDAPGVGDAVALRPGVGGIEQIIHEAGAEGAALDRRRDGRNGADPGLAEDTAAELRADDRFVDHL